MSRPPPDTPFEPTSGPRSRAPRSLPAVDALLRDLGPQLRRGLPESPGSAPSERLATGLPAVDALLRGGLPRGRLSEIAGALSCGRTSLALALLARTTRRGEPVSVVDLSDAFDPASAEAAGVDLDRVLWVRPRAEREALRCARRLLEARGFAAVVLDLAASTSPGAPATWPRLARSAAGTGTALLLLSAARLAGTAAEVALELRLKRAHFDGSPPLLAGLETEVSLVRGRALAPGTAHVHLTRRAA